MSASSLPVIQGFPLSMQQARAWAFHGVPALTRASVTLGVDGPLDRRALAGALTRIVDRHEILRTTFQALPGMRMPMQVIEESGPVAVSFVDVAGVAAADDGRMSAGRMIADRIAADHPPSCLVVTRAPGRHTIVITLPGLCADAVALTNLGAELAAAYAAVTGTATSIEAPAEPLQYADFSEWQRGAPATGDSAAGQRFWQQQTASSGGSSSSSDAARDAVTNRFTPVVARAHAGASRTERIRRIAAERGVSEATFWMTCWSILLWRRACRADVVVGWIADGRRHPEMRTALGRFATCLPIRSRGSWNSSFAEVLAAIERVRTEAETWQEVYAPPDAGTTAAAAFEYQSAPPPHRVGDTTFTVVERRIEEEPFQLKLTCVAGGADTQTVVQIDANRLPPKAAAHISAQLYRVMDEALASIERTAAQFDLMTDVLRETLATRSDRARPDPSPQPSPRKRGEGAPSSSAGGGILSPSRGEGRVRGLAGCWPDTTTDVVADVDRPLAWHVAGQADRTPDAVAVAGGGAHVTYAALMRHAQQLARDLRARGADEGACVAVLMRRSPRLLAALLGVASTGAAYVPLDPGDPPSRLGACLEDAAAAIVLVDPGFDSTRLSNVTCVTIDNPAASDLDQDQPPTPLEAPPGGDSLAYIIYTSGSTGAPKGALITQRGLMNYLIWATQYYELTAGSVMPLHSSLAVDLTVTSLFAPLLVGGTVVLAEQAAPAEALAQVLQSGPCFDVVKLTPSHLQALTWQMSPEALGDRAGALIIGGEALSGDMLRAWRQAAPRLRIFNEYGPTETVVGSCVHEVARDISPGALPSGPVPIGHPIANTQLYVCDPFGMPLGPDLDGLAEGELFIGGLGVARGYLHRPDLTAERFVPDPFGGVPGARLYRTGDTVCYDADGALVYVGRRDDQVKVRGHRIELGDVEMALRALPFVRDAAAAVHRDAAGTAQLVGYAVAVPMDAGQPSLDVLRAALLERVPEPLVPDAMVWLDELPLRPGGKVDRRALPAPDGARDRSRPMTPASTDVEEVLAAIWADVLRVEDVGVEDNFFALGGDSIRAIQMRARARDRGLEITHEQIFEQQTIASLARAVRAGSSPAGALPPLTPFALIPEEDRERLAADSRGGWFTNGEIDDAYPLAALQAGMIFHSELAGDSAVFHDLHSFTLAARPEIDLLRQALRAVMQRHAVLRTAFELARYSRPLQIVYRDLPVPLEVSDLRDVPVDEQRPAVDRWLERERRRPFDWRVPPLLRFHVHLLGDAAFQFTLSFHHATLDGWSAASLLTDLFSRYQAGLARLPASAPTSAPTSARLPDGNEEPPLRSSFRDFVALEQQAENSEACQQFWRETLARTHPTWLASRLVRTDGKRPDRIGTLPVAIAPGVVAKLRKMTRELALPLKSVALAAHAKVLAMETDQPRILTGLVSNGRPEEIDGDRVLGLFLNTIPCAVSLSPPRWRDLVEEAFHAERRLLPMRRYPLARLQREQGEGALFDQAFNFMHYHVYRGVRPSESIRVEGYFGYEETDVPLMANFSVDPESGEMGLLLGYHADAFDERDIQRLAARYGAVLEAMAADPDAAHANAVLLTPGERAAIAAHQAPRETPPLSPAESVSLLDAFEGAAAAFSDAIAVVSRGSAVSYAALHERADMLARTLRAHGVAADVPVAIAVDRSPDLLVGLLGILKAAGAYVPLDPGYPPARLSLVIDDAKPRVIVTTDAIAPVLPESGALQVRLHEGVSRVVHAAGEIASPEPAPPERDARSSAGPIAGHLAYVMYTSGSTGRPKGVMVPHGAVVNFMHAMDACVGDVSGASWLAVTSVAFDISVLELLWTLARGARVVLAESGAAETPAADLMRDEGITHLQCTPSWAWRLIAGESTSDTSSAGTSPAGPLSGLERLLIGGEALPPTLAGELLARVGGTLHNMYGPTETTIWSSADRVTQAATITLGRAVRNSWLHLIDRAWHHAAPGRLGEICIAGDGVARGYLGRPDLTAERFIPDPFSGEPGARMYRTGDWGRLREDGRVEFGGRRDGQVKLRGHRIELAEVEAGLRGVDGVRDAVATLREDTPGERRLVGYVVAASDRPLKPDVVQQALRTRLPEAMVPSAIVSMERLPLTPNGKIDRQRLPAPAGARPDLTPPYVEPRSDVEAALARIWREVLHVDRVGVHDNFFALGGHSLNATQVVARVRDAFAINLPLRPIFDAPTIARLAPIIDAHRTGSPPAATPARFEADHSIPPTPDIDALLDQLEHLPDEEVRALLGGDA